MQGAPTRKLSYTRGKGKLVWGRNKDKALTVSDFQMYADGAANTERAVVSIGTRECVLTGAYVSADGCLVLQADPHEDEISIFEAAEISQDADRDAEVLLEDRFGRYHKAVGFEVDEEWGRAYIW